MLQLQCNSHKNITVEMERFIRREVKDQRRMFQNRTYLCCAFYVAK